VEPLGVSCPFPVKRNFITKKGQVELQSRIIVGECMRSKLDTHLSFALPFALAFTLSFARSFTLAFYLLRCAGKVVEWLCSVRCRFAAGYCALLCLYFYLCLLPRMAGAGRLSSYRV
jgi:hypothetical protein